MASIFIGYTPHEPNDDKLLTKINSDIAKGRFLELYMHTAHVARTCTILGLVPRTVYHWKYNDEQFAADFEMAKRVALGILEDEAVRRAVYGTNKPVFFQGRQVGYIKEYSDSLLIVLLKANAPHKYKERFSNELTGADGKPLNSDLKIYHVHSEIPIAEDEANIVQGQINEANGLTTIQYRPPTATPVDKLSRIEEIVDQNEIDELLS